MFLISLLAFSVSHSWQTATAFAQGAQEYCQYGQRTVLIFVDRTTAYDDIDKAIFVEGFDRIMARLMIGDAVVVHTIQDSYANSSIVFNACLPGCPDEGFMNWLVGTCKSVIARGDEAQFRAELAKSIRNLLDNPQSYRQSDIIRTVASVSNTYAARAENDKGAVVAHLFLFSDLLENSDVIPWALLRNGTVAPALEIVRRSEIRPALPGTQVAAFGFGRLHDKSRRPLTPTQERGLREFWQSFFRLGGASDVYIGQHMN